MIVDEPTPCFGLHDLFESIDPTDHEYAKSLCDECPVIAACRKHLANVLRDSTSGGRPEGTWAGQYLANNQIRDRRTPGRMEVDDQMYSDEEARNAYMAFRTGRTDDWTKTGARVYRRRQKRSERAAKKVA